MENGKKSGIEIENAIIAVGSFLYNTDNSIMDLDKNFLEDLMDLIEAELERREAQLH
jgi:hypothetical protein|tara:strand:- start:227 stop:397 length:171 start_codon:yes stop_codon:yes gene_type:complete